MLAEKDLQARAWTLARELADAEIDENELGNLETFLRDTTDTERFWSLLAKLPASGQAQRSHQTARYYRTIGTVLQTERRRDLGDLRRIVAWTRRLLTYLNAERERQAGRSQHGAPGRQRR
jgi:hypothetical protein